jgi:hypothetical protein
MLLFVLLACTAEIPEPVEVPPAFSVLTAPCEVGEYAVFALGDAEAVSAAQCEAETDRCYAASHDRGEDGEVRVYCSEQYEYARVVVLYP